MRIFTAIAVPTMGLIILAGCEGKLKKPDPVPVQTAVERPAYGYIHRALTYREDTDASGATVFSRGQILLELGEPLAFLGTVKEGLVEGAQDRMALIRTEDAHEVWVRERYIVPGAQLGVVTVPEAVLYNRAKDTSPSPNVLPRGILVAVHPEDIPGFHKVSGWDHKTVHANLFLKFQTISVREEDVQSALLYYLAGRSDNEVVKKELLKSAAIYGDSFMAVDIATGLKEMSEQPENANSIVVAELGDRPSERFSALATISVDGVNVRSLPIETGSEQLDRLASGKPIVIVARTRDDFEVAGVSAPWYRISEPVQGWVFGAFVELP